MTSSEKDALLPSNASGSGPSYYFLKNDSSSHEARDMDGGEVIEQLPAGATEDDFASRAVGTPRAVSKPLQLNRIHINVALLDSGRGSRLKTSFRLASYGAGGDTLVRLVSDSIIT